MKVLQVEPVSRLKGDFAVPGDKSITHRAFLLGGLAHGTTSIRGANGGGDCEASLRAVIGFGARVTRPDAGVIHVHGTAGGVVEPPSVVDCGNSGTTMRLGAAIAARVAGLTVLSGDASLCSRPMQRVIEPLERMGARIWSRADGRAPLAIRGGRLRGIDYRPAVASAQVKSAILLAGLAARGTTRVVEAVPTRDHTERMLERFGVELHRESRALIVEGGATLEGCDLVIPGDPSAAAFFVVAALVLEDSEVEIRDVCVNPTRRGLIDVLIEMGGEIEVRGATEAGLEPVATIVARSSELRGLTVSGDRIPALIDELPVLAVAAAFARGTTTVADATELRVKESDRIDRICRNLGACGVRVEERPDGFVIHGGARPRGATTDADGDHRVAMAMAVMGLAASGRTTIRGAGNIGTSFPDFVEQLAGVGALT